MPRKRKTPKQTASTTYGMGPESSKKETKGKRVETLFKQLQEWAESKNVAEEIDQDVLDNLGSKVIKEYNIDENSRAEWKQTAEKALSMSKMKTSGTKRYPFDGAANVKYPLLSTAALQFAARAYPAIVDGMRVVKGQVIGDDETGEKRSKADRVSRHMSHQLLNEMEEWEEDTDILLHQLPITGCAFRKVWYDPILERNRSEMISALDLVVNQKATSMETVPRISQKFSLYPHEIEERVADGIYLDCEYGVALAVDDDDDAPHEFVEQHRYIDLDGDGYREPWIVVVHCETEKVARITANFDPDKLKATHNRIARIPRYNVFVKYSFFRDPEGGFYDLGFGELLKTISETIDSSLNQMLDAGHLQNAGGGFIGSGLSLKKQQLRFAPGQYHTVNAPGSKVREAIVNMDHPGPSPVLFNLLGLMVEAGKELSNVKDILSGDLPRGQTATTTLAMIEQGMKVYTAIYKRVYRSLKKEYQLLFELNARFLPDEQYFIVLDSRKAIARADYDMNGVDVAPVADPSVVTDMQKMARAQIYREAAADPTAREAGINVMECWRRFFEAVGSEDIEQLVPEKDPANPPPQEVVAMEAANEQLEQLKQKTRKDTADAIKAMADAALAVSEVKDKRKKGDKADAEEFDKDLRTKLDGLLGFESDQSGQIASAPNGNRRPIAMAAPAGG